MYILRGSTSNFEVTSVNDPVSASSYPLSHALLPMSSTRTSSSGLRDICFRNHKKLFCLKGQKMPGHRCSRGAASVLPVNTPAPLPLRWNSSEHVIHTISLMFLEGLRPLPMPIPRATRVTYFVNNAPCIGCLVFLPNHFLTPMHFFCTFQRN